MAHPFREYGMGDLTRSLKVDAVEILNGGSSKMANQQAKELAKELGLPGTAGSDAHQTSELFSVCTQVQASLNIDEILKAIKNGFVSAQQATGSIHF